MEKINFDYFYRIFIDECKSMLYKKKLELLDSKLVNNENEIEVVFGFYNTNDISLEDGLYIYDTVLKNICLSYLCLSKSIIEIIPDNVFELIKLILENTTENDYKESFFTSLQFIYQDYFELLGLGRPMLWSSNDDRSKSFEMNMDSKFKLLDFNSKNLNIIEQDEIINDILLMEHSKLIGPHRNVLIKIRKDI